MNIEDLSAEILYIGQSISFNVFRYLFLVWSYKYTNGSLNDILSNIYPFNTIQESSLQTFQCCQLLRWSMCPQTTFQDFKELDLVKSSNTLLRDRQ